jgi:hypothetical protein
MVDPWRGELRRFEIEPLRSIVMPAFYLCSELR